MASSPDYVLPRDFADNNRINLQHYLWKETFGYLVHPSIPINSPSLRIADVGTGTGIWLTHLGGQLPKSVQLDGLDVSFDAAPPKGLLPENVKFFDWDIRQPAPAELIGVYDIVHIRNFSFVLQEEEIEPILGRLIDLLKPGGYLQWGEPDVASFRIEQMNPKSSIEALTKLLKVSQPQDARFSPKWVSKLAAMFSDASTATGKLHDVKADVKEAPPHVALATHECNIVMPELLSRRANNTEILGQIEELMPEVAKETRDGAYWAFTRHVVVGQKVANN